MHARRLVRLTIATEAHFERGPDGVVRSDTGGRGHAFWSRYLAEFSSVTVLARVSDVRLAVGVRVDGPGVSVAPLTGYQGMSGLGRALPKLRREVRAVCGDPDSAYIGRLPGIVSSLMIRAANANGYPYAVEVVGDPYEVVRAGAVPTLFQLPLRALGYEQMRRQCGSAETAAYVTRQALQTRYPATRARYVTHYSSVELQDEAFVDAPAQHGNARPVCVCVGTLAQTYKGQDVLVKAAAILRTRGRLPMVRFVGDGRYRQRLQDQVLTLGLQETVEFCGRLSTGESVRQEFDRADVFVLPSRTEGLPRALLEAMARGLPCVASRVGGIPELLAPEDLVEPNHPAALADVLGRVLSDPERRREMARRNLQTARQYHASVLSSRRNQFLTATANPSLGANQCS